MPPAQGNAGRSPTVSVVILALDEAGNIPLVLDGLPPLVGEVIVVDGGSADNTVAIVRQARPDAQVVQQSRTGKGNALVCGIALCQGDIVVTLNGDGSTDPGEIPRFVDALLAGAEVAHGSRFRSGGDDLAGTALGRLGNRWLSRKVNRSFGTRFTDVGTGYNAFWRTHLIGLDLPLPELPGRRGGRAVWGDGSEIEPLVNIRMAAEGLRVMEVATIRYPRIHGRRRRHGLAHAMRAWRVLRHEQRRQAELARRPSPPARHDAAELGPAPVRIPRPRTADMLRPAAPPPATYVVGDRTTGRHAIDPVTRRPYPGPRPDWADSVDRSGPRGGLYQTGTHQAGVHRHSGLYDTGIHRTGTYDTGMHRSDVYDTGVASREVGGGRRRLDADDRRTEPRTGVTGEGGPR